MANGERIRYFRKLRGLTQKQLGVMAGMNEKTADIRISQYESGLRSPKEDMLNRLAYILGVLPEALNVTNIESYTDVMQILFALEDMYGLKIGRTGDDYIIRLNKKHGEYPVMKEMFKAWYEEAMRYYNRSYNDWRYNFTRDKD
ncbi:MAG: helix-turn-helix domain-containing protein [Ruminococcus sp.]|nr:helix-turn-helix domain-containing protein [Ruminococcus sp.]MCM1167799.1 helix-turn-helix domain-containing protein [Ruminococcus sp.]